MVQYSKRGVKMSEGKSIQVLTNELLNSHWPKCNKLAEEILNSFDPEDAKIALIKALRAKRHHIRTAAIHELSKLNDTSIIDIIKKHLDDPAYETREEAKKALKLLTGKDFSTAKGE